MNVLDIILICLVPYSIELAIACFFIKTANNSDCKFKIEKNKNESIDNRS